MNLISMATSIVLAVIFVGAVLGFFRGWKKSLVRLVTLIVSVVASILIAPVVSSSFISKHVSGSVVTIFSKNINIQDALNNISQDVQLGELFAAGSTTNEVVVALVNIVVNLFLFIAIFFLLQIFSLIIYWIVCIILKVQTRYDEKEKPEKDGKFWGLKVLSMIFGILGSVAISFVVLTPIYGMMNVCDGFISESEISEESASAATGENFVCGGLYYTEDKKIGVIEGYIQKYADLKAEYESTFIGKFMKITGLGKAGSGAFKHLTTVKQGGLTLNLTYEFVHISKAYNKYKEVFVEDKFYFTDNKDVDDLVELYDDAVESEILKSYVVELIPQMSDKWTSGEKFLGIENPISGVWKETINSAMVVFKIDNISRISGNFKAFANAIKTANDNEVIDRINKGDKIEDIISDADEFVSDEIVILTSTNELRDNVSIVLSEVFEALYSEILGKDVEFQSNRLSAETIHEINRNNGWVVEANNIQNAIDKTFEVYDQIKKDSSNEAIADELEKIGMSIDFARESQLISNPFKTFITGFIQEKTNFKESVKTSMLETINSKWGNSEVNFAKTFKALEETAKIADQLGGEENVSFEGLTPTLESIADDTATKGVLADMIDSGIIDEVAGEGSSTEVLTDVLESFVTSKFVDGSTVENDIAAGEQIVNTVNNIEKTGSVGLGETEEERTANADKLIGDLVGSKAMMELLANSCASQEGSAITDKTQNISNADKQIIAERIDALNLEEDEVTILKATFGIA